MQNPWPTDLEIDDLALASPGTGSAACSYHSRVSFRNIVELAVTIHAGIFARFRLDGAAV